MPLVPESTTTSTPTTVAVSAEAQAASSKPPITKIPNAITTMEVTQPQPFSS